MLALLLVLAAVGRLQPPWAARLQAAWFDGSQVLLAAQVATLPVRSSTIDEKSLAGLGQWPWPRNLLARPDPA